MCDFHSTIWRLIGQDVQMFHLASNSHSEMVAASGWRENEPNRKVLVFEAEWNGAGEMPGDSRLVKSNFGECPDKVIKAIRKHCLKLKEALSEGKHFDKYFADAKVWGDVWTAAMRNGQNIDFSEVTEFTGYIYVRQGATLTAPKLAKSGYIDVRQRATLTAPKLAKSGSIDVQQGATLTAPKLAKSGYIYVRQGATLTAPKLAKSGYIDVQQGATLTAPKLAKSGSIDVQQGATLTAPELKEVSGSIDVRQRATLTAPELKEVSGSIDVRQRATLTAPKLAKSGSIDVQQGATLTAPKLKRN